MKNVTLHSDLINKKIKIMYGFEVDYNPSIKEKDFNNNGTWGKIISKGVEVKSIPYNPNKIAPNFGESDYETQFRFMQRQLEIFRAMQPKQIEAFIKG